jgi:flagellar basal-body rod protein FlgC
MSIFPVLETAQSALHTNRVWMDAVADNIANINTVRPTSGPAFQARFIVATAKRADNNDPIGDPKGRTVYEPGNPLADKAGLVRYPDIDLGDQMTQLLMAQRAYQLNLAVVDRARDAYLQALNINGR